MTIHIYLVTHDLIGKELLKTVATMMDLSHLNINTISIPSNITAAQQAEYAHKVNASIASSLENDKLILCDIYGATPHNLVKKLKQKKDTVVITGLNLGMLLKAVQTTQKTLQQASQDIFQSAQKSIVLE